MGNPSTADKSTVAFRTISEVATRLGVPKHVLRFWEGKFPQVKPMKRGGGRRYYRPEDIELLQGIRSLLHSDGYTIKGVQKILREQGVRHVKDMGKRQASAEQTASMDGPKTGNEEDVSLPSLAPRLAIGSASKSGNLAARKPRGLEPAAPNKAAAGAAATSSQLSKVQRDEIAATIKQLEDCRAILRETANEHKSAAESGTPVQARLGKHV